MALCNWRTGAHATARGELSLGRRLLQPGGKGPDGKGPDGKGPDGKGPDGKGPDVPDTPVVTDPGSTSTSTSVSTIQRMLHMQSQ